MKHTAAGRQSNPAPASRARRARYRCAAHRLEVFRTWYGPIHRAFAALVPEAQRALAADLTALVERFNVARGGTRVAPSAYLEAVIARQ